MPLQPSQPPGRSSRKARAFEGEIVRLHEAGYSIKVIRDALEAAGVKVGRTTVRREIDRNREASHRSRASPPAARTPTPIASPAAGTIAPTTQRASARAEGGKEIAQAFLRDRITNPLLRARS